MNNHTTDEPASSDGGDSAEPENSALGPDEVDDSTETETFVDPELCARLWLKTIVPILQLTPTDPPPCGRVQYALDKMMIAACERAARILRKDLSEDQR